VSSRRSAEKSGQERLAQALNRSAEKAGQEWLAQAAKRSGEGGDRKALSPEGRRAQYLPAPAELSAEVGAGQVTLRWSEVAGAAGYLVGRAATPVGPYTVLDHGGSDVLAVPGPPYADTTVEAGRSYAYRVAATCDGGRSPIAGEPSAPVVVGLLASLPTAGAGGPDAAGAPEGPGAAPEVPAPRAAGPVAGARAPEVLVEVDAGKPAGKVRRVWEMVGSERLSQLDHGRDRFGNLVGAEFKEALAIAHDELGAKRVRAHAIFHDDLGVFSELDGKPTFDFSRVDRVLGTVLDTGLAPVLELSFMPRALARDPAAVVFSYRAHISPPKDWGLWGELCARLAAHLVERFGAAEVAKWAFEVWNEPNLQVFWAGTQAEYLRLYEVAAQAVKGVDEKLHVGGPATAAAEWVEDFAAFAERRAVPVDFVSTHTYGNVPIDLRPALARHGLAGAEIYWTEWGVGAGHFSPVHGTAFDAPFLLRGYKAVQDRVDAVAHWVVSDHFEELGRPERLFHNGFGLLTVGNLRKPRFWAQKMASELGDDVLLAQLEGDGAGSLVDAWAARSQGGRIDVLVWNGSPDASRFEAAPGLRRSVTVKVTGLETERWRACLARVDDEHSNIARLAPKGRDWPSREQWAGLRAADKLFEESLGEQEARGGVVTAAFELPMPGVARLRLTPAGAPLIKERGG
jgi:xylan 1,4-beta-xylosidase